VEGATSVHSAETLGYQSMLDGLTTAEVKDLEALLDKLLTRLDELSAMQQPWT